MSAAESVGRLRAAVRDVAMRVAVVEADDVRRVVEDLDITLARADAAEAECARLRECLARANGTIEETERARYAAEDDRDAARAEVAALRAIIAGRVTPPTDVEIAAHLAAGGDWLVRKTLDATLIPRTVRWHPLDATGCPTTWPVTP